MANKFIIFCLFPVLLLSNGKGLLKGKVTIGEEKSTVSGINIVLVGHSIGTTTDARGVYEIENVPEGKYDVEFSFAGYKRERVFDILISSNKETEVNASLKESPFQVNDVVVTASLNRHILKNTPVVTEVISQTELQTIGSSNLSDVLQTQTGVEISIGIGQTQSAQLHGLNDSHVLILVDGERITGRVNGAVDLGQIPVNTIDKIEVVKGPLSSIYGSDALGGVVNIITKDAGRAPLLHLAATVGTYGRQDYEISGAKTFDGLFGNETHFKFFANAGWNKFFGVDYDKNDNFMEMPESDRRHINLKTGLQINNKLWIDAKGEYYTDKLQWLAGDRYTYVLDIAENKKFTTAASANYLFNSTTSFKMTANYSTNDHRSLEQSRTGFAVRDNLTVESIHTYRAQLTTVPYKSSVLTFGYEYNNESAQSDRYSGRNRRTNNNVIYGEDEWMLLPFNFSIGGRFTNNSIFGNFFAPRISLLYNVTERLTLRGSYGRGFRAPSILELFIDYANTGVGYTVVGEPTLRPETSNGYNLGMQYIRDDLVWFRANVYYNYVDNLIHYYQKSATGVRPVILSYRNVDKATITGIDVDADFHLVEGLIIGIGYNHNSAKDENGNQLPFISPNTVNWKLTYTQKEYGFIASMRGRWYDKKPVMDEQTNQSIYINAGDASYFFVSDYSVIDIKVSKKFFDMAEISTGINNITDKIIYPFGQIKGREFFVGASFNIK